MLLEWHIGGVNEKSCFCFSYPSLSYLVSLRSVDIICSLGPGGRGSKVTVLFRFPVPNFQTILFLLPVTFLHSGSVFVSHRLFPF